MQVSFASPHRACRPSIRLALALLCLTFGTLTVLAFTPAEAQAKPVNPYGLISAQYESNSNPASIVPGIAYGVYQMTPDNAHAFCLWLKGRDKTAQAYGNQLLAAYKKDKKRCGSRFDKAWRTIANKDPKTFHRQQYLYVKSITYTPAVNYLKANVPGFSISRYSIALRNVIFSTAVQHGAWGAYRIVAKAYQSTQSEKKLISQIYRIRAGYDTVKAIRAFAGPGAKIIAIKASDCQWYVANGLLTKKEAKALTGKALVNFYSSSGPEQVGVYYRLQKREKVTALDLYRRYA